MRQGIDSFGSFEDPSLEQEFRTGALAADVRFFRRIVLVFGALFLAYVAVDYVAEGLAWSFWANAAVRVSFFAFCLRVRRRLAGVADPAGLDRLMRWSGVVAVLAVAACLALSYVANPLPEGEHFRFLSQVVIVFAIYLSLPQDFRGQLALGAGAALVFLAVGVMLQRAGAYELLSLGIFLVLANAIGATFARNVHAGRRLEFRRIREEQELNERLRREIRRREESEEARNRLFSIIAHDLRSPLATTIGLSAILAEEVDTLPREEVGDLAAAIHRDNRSLLELLDTLLQWGHVRSGRLSFAPQTLDLSAVANEVVRLLRPTAEGKEVTIAVRIDPELRVSADRTLLATVLRNLIGNAVKFTPAGGRVRVAAGRDGDRIRIEVSDTGVGIPADRLESLFQFDDRNVRAGTAGERGTGFGLLVCRDLVERHGGRLRAESEVGVGSTFSFDVAAEASQDAVVSAA